MQVKVQTVSELIINQLSDDQYKAERAAGRINAGEVYACTPSPVKWEDIQGKPDVSGGGDVDFQELARRIPSWQWKVTMPKTVNQTVTATVGGKTYTSDFYAQQGSNVTFSVKADAGYVAGSLSTISATLVNDLAVTVAVATESEEIEAGTIEIDSIGGDGFVVPPKVSILKLGFTSGDIYVKVNSGGRIVFMVNHRYGETQYEVWSAVFDENQDHKNYQIIKNSDSEPTISWSKEINEHATDYDWTK